MSDGTAKRRPARTLDDIDLYDPETYVAGVPHDMFALLRREAPVFWHRDPDGPGFWAITKYDDLIAVSKDPKTFSSAARTSLLKEPKPEDMDTMRLMMLNMDPPRHSKLRLLVNKGFTPRMTARMEPHIRHLTNEIIDAIAERGTCDFVESIAAELPLLVIAELMGVPRAERRLLFEWSNRLIGFDDPEYATSPDDGQIAATEMYLYANRLVTERRKAPGEDIISVLMNAEVDGERLTEMEFDLFFLLLAVAGNETTRNLMSGGLHALFEHPQEQARLVARPDLIPSAVEEMLRYVSPVMHFRRTATRDTELRGQKIRAGDKVVMWHISANRDEDVFPDADRFDVTRSPNDHVAFGFGTHFCLGANLARLEIRILFEELLRRLPDLAPAGPVARLRSNFINGVKHLPVRFTPQRRGATAAVVVSPPSERD